MSATRLKGKPLLEINNVPIISHVFNKASETGLEAVVATEDIEIVNAVEKNGGRALLTKRHKTGTDRIYEALNKLKVSSIDFVLNLQGDEPMINPTDIINLNKLMMQNKSDIGTLASEIKDKSILNNKNIVKVITEKKLLNNDFSKALNFFRNNNIIEKLEYIYHHIGIYCYKVSALEKFVGLSQTKNEIKNRLEQLRALDNNIEISVALAESSPIGIDTKEDYLALKKIMEYK